MLSVVSFIRVYYTKAKNVKWNWGNTDEKRKGHFRGDRVIPGGGTLHTMLSNGKG